MDKGGSPEIFATRISVTLSNSSLHNKNDGDLRRATNVHCGANQQVPQVRRERENPDGLRQFSEARRVSCSKEQG